MLIDAPDNWMSTDDKPTIILHFLREKGECKTSDISDFLGLKPTQTKAYLSKLVKAGKIIAHGANRNRTYTLA